MTWNPGQYHKFQAERSAPFFDLLKLVNIRPGLQAVDLGCGTGELTRRLADALPNGDVLGIDLSPEMLEKAKQFEGASLKFEQGNQAALTGEWDLIFSNAALQWSEDHEQLVPSLFAKLKMDGQLVAQVPSNHFHVSHQLIRETAGEEPFFSALDGYNRQSPVLSIERYAEILFECGAKDILTFEKAYPHILEDSDAIVEWIRGTALVPYLERLGSQKDAFIEAIRAKLKDIFPGSPVFYPFKRTFFSAIR
ncbi:MAG: methyltransferase domain-containing protein [Chloroflexi bacterium]|nr:methyltransferase domain-containing protein [Chloroflexota bacterium]